MRIFSVPALFAAALVSVVVTLPFLKVATLQPDVFVLDAELTTSVEARVQVFYDDGRGISEGSSATVVVTPESAPVRYHFPMPSGMYRMLRFDPLDRPGKLRISSVRILAPDGALFRDLPLGEFKPVNDIHSFALQGGGLEIVATDNDPQVALTFEPPIHVPNLWGEYLIASLPYATPAFLVLAAGLFLLERATRFRTAWGRWTSSLASRPRLAVAAVALGATVFSAYPVVFLGKSHVSPNLGTILLYDAFPTLPGYDSAETAEVKLSDIGAIMWQHVPFSTIQHRALWQGEFPLWNRYNAAGVPLLAQGQSMFGDPLHFLVIAANGRAWAWDLKYLIAKWLFAAGLGLIVLSVLSGCGFQPQMTVNRSDSAAGSRSHFPDLGPSLLVAAAAPFIGFFLYRINHPAFFSLCYAPWPLYCLVRIAQSPGRRGVAGWATGLLVANLALMNSGTVKEAYMLLVSVNFSGACVLLATGATWRERLGKLAAVAWAGVIFVLLTTPIWATFLNTLKAAYTGYNTATAYQIQPTLLLGFFDEIFYRPLLPEDRVFSPSLNFLLLLGFLYFLATLREHFPRPAVVALAASSLVPLALAFGFVSPRWIASVPFLGNVAHLDNTFSCVLIVLWSVLGGIGFAAATRRLGTREGGADLVIVFLLLGALVFGWVAFGQAQHRPILGPTFTVNQPGEFLPVSPLIRQYLVTLLVAAVVLAFTLRRAALARRLTSAGAMLVLGCGLLLLWRHGLHSAAVGFDNYTAQPTERVSFHTRSPAVEFVRDRHAREPGRGFGLRGNFFPGWTGRYGLETVHGPDALVNPWLRELVGASGLERIWDWRLYVEPHGVGQARPFLDALNVRYYFDLQSDQGVMGRALKLLLTADLDVYESPTAWPRAFFTDRVAVYNQPAELVAHINAANGRPLAAVQQEALASARLSPSLRGDLAARSVVPATEYRLTENTTSFRIRNDRPGIIVLTEAFWPGDFQAEVDGTRVPIVRVNHAFKGIVLDAAGDHHVTFRYWPRHFSRHLMFAALGSILFVASLGIALRRPQRTQPASSGPMPVEPGPAISSGTADPGHSSAR